MVGYFGYRLGETSVYPQFGHLLDALMGSMCKDLVEEFTRKGLTHAVYIW